MERNLKAPYIPPKDKIITENEDKKNEKKNVLVIDEVRVIIIFI